MKPDIVVDIGNSRMKWGRCSANAVSDTAALSADDPGVWEAQLAAWKLTRPLNWAVSGVAPKQRDALIDWLRAHGHTVALVDSPAALPLTVDVEKPAAVGIDRLLNAVAANARRQPHNAAIVVDAGSAVTVDQVSADGHFQGGAIFPGLRLMSRALHDYTALLPVVEVTQPAVMPARSTVTAIQAGVFWAVAGGIAALVRQLTETDEEHPSAQQGTEIFLTGGDALILEQPLRSCLRSPDDATKLVAWSAMTLEGLRLAAEAQP